MISSNGKTILVAAAAVLVGGLVGVAYVATRDDVPAQPQTLTERETESSPTEVPNEVPSETQPEATPAGEPSTSPENVTGAPAAVSLGFNNSEQVVDAGDGTQMVWIDRGMVVLATRSANGTVTATTTVHEGTSATLPAIARGNMLAVGWTAGKSVYAAVSSDGGKTFGEATNLGAGTGISLAASGDRLVAVWHTGAQGTASDVQFRSFDGNEWAEAAQIDESSASPVWASVDVNGDRLFATWRDNSTGQYVVMGRHSTDGGRTWGPLLSLATTLTGDPDVCLTDAGDIWVAHHGLGKITLVHSKDGSTFDKSIAVGNGFFAHLSCTNSTVAVAWEETTGRQTSSDKRAGYAVYTGAGTKLASGAIDDGSVAATSIHVYPAGSIEVLWLKTGSTPLAGTLRHQTLELN